VFRGAIVQGASLVFSKDGSFFIFDCEASTVAFCNIAFAYGYIITMVGSANNFTFAGEYSVILQIN
jgi:hypothetical protein